MGSTVNMKEWIDRLKASANRAEQAGRVAQESAGRVVQDSARRAAPGVAQGATAAKIAATQGAVAVKVTAIRITAVALTIVGVPFSGIGFALMYNGFGMENNTALGFSGLALAAVGAAFAGIAIKLWGGWRFALVALGTVLVLGYAMYFAWDPLSKVIENAISRIGSAA